MMISRHHLARARHGLASVAHRLGDELVRPQQVAEQLQIEFVVLDNEHPFRHVGHRSFPVSGR
jgi:hypothetical protein